MIRNARELITLTKLTDYCYALPKVSSAIFSNWVKHELEDFWESAPELLGCAYRLRQLKLFHDCLAAIAGSWVSGEYTENMS